MRRRDFVSSCTAALLTTLAEPLSALQQSVARPKVMLFGFTVIKRNGNSILAHMPMHNYHRPFAAGSEARLGELWPAMPKPSHASQKRIHVDLPLDHVVCIEQRNQKMSASGLNATVFSETASASLPNLAKLAREFNAEYQYTLALQDIPTFTIELMGGELRLPYQASHAAGTHAALWRFYEGAVEKGDTTRLTDLLVFESNSNSLTLRSPGKSTTLGPGEALWLLNLPTQVPEDLDLSGKPCKTTPARPDQSDCENLIENAHHVFEVLNHHDRLPKGIYIKSLTRFQRLPPIADKFVHPCAAEGLTPGYRRYIPPDTDPCFITQV